MSPFLWMGDIFNFSLISGNVLSSTQFLKMIESGFAIAKSHSFNNILIDISGPQASEILMLIMSLSSNWTEESLSSVKKV